ncbi:DUF3310 domain-containing protein [Fructilactobacillus florum]|uniref:DUF3310 domain-containing protein n=1 Tax=Fructilactobacillus florum TaxID=640331 RepID=UPI0006CF4971
MTSNLTPNYYKNGEYDLLEHMMDILTNDEFRGFCVGNIIKYVVRYKRKEDPIGDLCKASEYLDRLIYFEKGLTK